MQRENEDGSGADGPALSSLDHPILVVDLLDSHGKPPFSLYAAGAVERR